MTKFAAAALSLLLLGACHQQPSLDGTSSQPKSWCAVIHTAPTWAG